MTSSSGDSAAPLDFQISSSIEDNCKISVATEDCPLCSKPRKNFYCKVCIRNGDFIHSTSRYAERFADKQLRLLNYKQDKLKIEKLCEAKLQAHLQVARIASEIDMCKDRVKFLSLLIKDKKDLISERRQLTTGLGETNNEKLSRLPRYEERVGKLENFVKNRCAELKEQEERLHLEQEKLKKVIRKNVEQLVHFIFPITTIKPYRSSDDSETVNALAEASRTAFVRGKWIFSDISTESQHCIVAPTLPSSGDYSAYNYWVAANKDGVPGPSNDAVVDHNPAYNISAALTYTTQLTNLLAFYLDIRLPTKLCYSEFCGNELNEDKFAKRVARLNWNVLHLCLSQNVSPKLLNPQSTLQNILHLLNPETSDLGRIGACEVDPEASRALEDSLRPALEAASDSEDSEDDSDHLPYEWETVPNFGLPEVAAGPANQNISSQQISSTSVASGLVTSAAASLASFWRGWTTNR